MVREPKIPYYEGFMNAPFMSNLRRYIESFATVYYMSLTVIFKILLRYFLNCFKLYVFPVQSDLKCNSSLAICKVQS